MKEQAGEPVFAGRIDDILADKIIRRADEHIQTRREDAPAARPRQQPHEAMARARRSLLREIAPWLMAAVLICVAALWAVRRR
jgi:type VI protein secretion system component VasF